jgi:DNA-binding beta-propeller fold protein YncE
VDRTNKVLLRIDPASAKVVKRIPIGPLGAGLAIVDGAVWVADAMDGTIRRVDPKTNAAVVIATIPGGAIWFADDGKSHLAVCLALTGQVTILDASTGAAKATVGGWLVPYDGTVIGSTAWVPDGRAAVVRLIDLSTDTLTASLALPGGIDPFVAEVVKGEVWVLDFGGPTIWRIRP